MTPEECPYCKELNIRQTWKLHMAHALFKHDDELKEYEPSTIPTQLQLVKP